MIKDKKLINNWFILSNFLKNVVVMELLWEILRKMINLENDFKDLILGEGKFGKVIFVFY